MRFIVMDQDVEKRGSVDAHFWHEAPYYSLGMDLALQNVWLF